MVVPGSSRNTETLACVSVGATARADLVGVQPHVVVGVLIPEQRRRLASPVSNPSAVWNTPLKRMSYGSGYDHVSLTVLRSGMSYCV